MNGGLGDQCVGFYVHFDLEYCIDTCEAPGYKCEKLENVAHGKTITASSVFRGEKSSHRNAVDGNTAKLLGIKGRGEALDYG